MAVVNVGSNNWKFQCLSSDAFPEGKDNGATLHVVDTGETYVYHDGSWEPDLRLQHVMDSIL